jgi:hypothetical protein
LTKTANKNGLFNKISVQARYNKTEKKPFNDVLKQSINDKSAFIKDKMK